MVGSVKLAQVVCATYCLSQPKGSTPSEIAKFCARRFGTKAKASGLTKLLRQAVDQGILVRFQRRYRLARMNCCILWGTDSPDKKCRTKRYQPRLKYNKPSGSARKHNKNKMTKVQRLDNSRSFRKNGYASVSKEIRAKATPFSKTRHRKPSGQLINSRKFAVNNTRKERHQTKQTKSHLNGRHLGIVISKTSTRISRRVQSIKKTKPKRIWPSRGNKETHSKRYSNKNRTTKCLSRRKIKSHHYDLSDKTAVNESVGRNTFHNLKSALVLKRQQMKNDVRSRREHHKKAARSRDPSDASEDGGKPNDKSEFHRKILRLTRDAVTHAESWDRLNHSRMRRQLENQNLMKSSRLVQKILTKEHARSWDDLNEKLRQMKEQGVGPMKCGQHGEPTE